MLSTSTSGGDVSNVSKEPDPSEYESASEGSNSDGYVTPGEEFDTEEKEVLDEGQIKKALKEAEDIKAQGSDHFRARYWNEALQDYQRALALVPPKRRSQLPSHDKGKKRAEEDSPEIIENELSDLDQECAKARAVLNGNIGACYSKLVRGASLASLPYVFPGLAEFSDKGDHKKVVEACTTALSDDSKYIKVLHRRAISNEALGTWSSLASAEQDYTNLINILPSHSPMIAEFQAALGKIVPRKEAAQSAEMGEMLQKLKGMGNNILGNFGLSTDNFKFEPNGQGGYSINFVR